MAEETTARLKHTLQSSGSSSLGRAPQWSALLVHELQEAMKEVEHCVTVAQTALQDAVAQEHRGRRAISTLCKQFRNRCKVLQSDIAQLDDSLATTPLRGGQTNNGSPNDNSEQKGLLLSAPPAPADSEDEDEASVSVLSTLEATVEESMLTASGSIKIGRLQAKQIALAINRALLQQLRSGMLAREREAYEEALAITKRMFDKTEHRVASVTSDGEFLCVGCVWRCATFGCEANSVSPWQFATFCL